MFIRTERLLLRPTWPEDWAEIHALIDDPALARHMARAPWPYSHDHARAAALVAQAPRFPHFAVTLPGDEVQPARLIGMVGFAPCRDAAELGFWIGREYWGRGFAREAVAAALTIARVIGHACVYATHFADNPASGRVLARHGFAPVGDLRLRYSAARGGADLALVHRCDLAPLAGAACEAWREAA